MDQNTQYEMMKVGMLIGQVGFDHRKNVLRSIIDWYNFERNCCRTSIERLADSAGISLRQFRAALVQLEADGWVVRKQQPGRPKVGTSTIHWILNIPKIRAELEPLLKQQSEEHRRKRPKLTKKQLEARAMKEAEFSRLQAENAALKARISELEASTPSNQYVINGTTKWGKPV